MSASQLSRALAGKKVFTLDQLDAVCWSLGLDTAHVIEQATGEASGPAWVRSLDDVRRERSTPIRRVASKKQDDINEDDHQP